MLRYPCGTKNILEYQLKSAPKPTRNFSMKLLDVSLESMTEDIMLQLSHLTKSWSTNLQNMMVFEGEPHHFRLYCPFQQLEMNLQSYVRYFLHFLAHTTMSRCDSSLVLYNGFQPLNIEVRHTASTPLCTDLLEMVWRTIAPQKVRKIYPLGMSEPNSAYCKMLASYRMSELSHGLRCGLFEKLNGDIFAPLSEDDAIRLYSSLFRRAVMRSREFPTEGIGVCGILHVYADRHPAPQLVRELVRPIPGCFLVGEKYSPASIIRLLYTQGIIPKRHHLYELLATCLQTIEKLNKYSQMLYDVDAAELNQEEFEKEMFGRTLLDAVNMWNGSESQDYAREPEPVEDSVESRLGIRHPVPRVAFDDEGEPEPVDEEPRTASERVRELVPAYRVE